MAAHSQAKPWAGEHPERGICPLDATGHTAGPGIPRGSAMSASGVAAARSASQQASGGANPTPALHSLQVQPIAVAVAKAVIVRHHYLHSLPGGTRLAFGVFVGNRLLGAITLGVGPLNAYSLVEDAQPDDCLTLTRLWLSDELPRNGESRTLGVVLR